MGTALITGASAGLGMEYARLFAADKHDLILVARRRERLDALAKELESRHQIRVTVITEDLQSPLAAQRIHQVLSRENLEVEFLVNNAGFGTVGPIVRSDLARELGQINVNVNALVALTQLFLPAMVNRRAGRILNIGSTAGFQPGPCMATYYATKAFVNSFTEALSYELKGTGVTATVSCPGPTATEFASLAGNDRSWLFRRGAMPARTVAEEGYQAMHAGKVMVVHGVMNKLGAWSVNFTPRSLLRSMVAAMIRDPQAVNQLQS